MLGRRVVVRSTQRPHDRAARRVFLSGIIVAADATSLPCTVRIVFPRDTTQTPDGSPLPTTLVTRLTVRNRGRAACFLKRSGRCRWAFWGSQILRPSLVSHLHLWGATLPVHQ